MSTGRVENARCDVGPSSYALARDQRLPRHGRQTRKLRLAAAGRGSRRRRNAWLRRSAASLVDRREEILAANARTRRRAQAAGLGAAAIDRLTLDAGRIDEMAQSLRDVAALPDPIGEASPRADGPTDSRSGRSASRSASSS